VLGNAGGNAAPLADLSALASGSNHATTDVGFDAQQKLDEELDKRLSICRC
jgi:hypothetical protein